MPLALLQGFLSTGPETVVVIDVLQLAVRSVVAAALGIVLAIVYRATHKGLSYSQSFTQTIVFVALIVAIVMMTVRNSLATAFTLVGALSIIRFRTVVKDTRDTAFVFAALALGMASGLGYWELAAIGVLVVCGLAMLLYATDFGSVHKSEFLLRFTCAREQDGTALQRIGEFARRVNLLQAEPTGDGGGLRLTYDVALRRDATAQQLTSAMAGLAGVSDVVLLTGRADADW